MIEFTVKTLDAKNYSFSVDDDTTVAQFKEILAGTVNVEAATQRLIYRGHVLPDAAKLKDLDVHGNVVHLVVKPPPSSSTSPSSSQSRLNNTAPPQNSQRRGMEFLGSMRFPAGGGPGQAISPNTLPRSRLNVAKRMLHRAEIILTSLEHPSGIQTTDQTCQVNPQDIATATSSGDSMPGTSTSSEGSNNIPPVDSGLSFSEDTPIMEDEEPMSEPGTSTANNNGQRQRTPEEGISLTDYATVLEKLQSVQLRFTPFLAEYGAFMREDPAVPDDEARQRQFNINRVAEILHFLGHAYHALSDIIIRVRNSPPRALLCRPLVIQHSTIVQAGIPIQVEAQINFGPTASANASQPSSRSSSQPPSGIPLTATNIGPTLIGFPIIPNMRAERVTPATLPVRPPTTTTATTATASTRFADLILNDSENQSESAPSMAPSSITLPTGPIIRGNAASARSIIERVQQSGLTNSINTSIIERMLSEDVDLMRLPRGHGNQDNQNMFAALNNPNVEVFMEIAPESVTVDSIETSFLSNDQQSAEYLQGTLNNSPDLIQSLVQVASALIGREVPPPATSSPNPSSEPSSTDTSTSPGGSARTNPFQNSQARGNTQTQPTTATHTRSTSRPHVQFSQHTLTTFDPFLPCNSHHIRRRQNAGHTANNSQQSQSNEDESNGAAEENGSQPLPQSALRMWQTIMDTARGSTEVTRPPQTATASPRTTALRTEIAKLLTQYHNLGAHVEGSSFILDTLIFLLRHLSPSDFEELLQGNPYPLTIVGNELRCYVLSRLFRVNSVNALSDSIIRSATDRLLDEFRPYIERLSGLETNDNIDVVRSVSSMLHFNIFQIINHLTYLTDSSSAIVNELKLAYDEFWTFILRVSRHGREDAIKVFQQLVTVYAITSQASIVQWPITTMSTVFEEYLSTLNCSENVSDVHTIKVGDPLTVHERRRKRDNAPTNPSSSGRSEPTSQPPVTTNNDVEMSSPNRDTPHLQAWRSYVPPSWVPIITTDSQRQRKQNSQPPFSDAYLSTLPTKRRKVIEDKKTPQGNSLPQIITDSVRRAVTSVNVDSSASSIEAVVQAVSSDSTLQAAYQERIRTAVQAQLQNRGDFEPTQFPNANDYFMDYQQ